MKGKVVIELSEVEVQRLLRVLLDEEKEEAFRFLKECLEKKIKDHMRPHCVPVFEVNYNPRQKDDFENKERVSSKVKSEDSGKIKHDHEGR